MLIPAQAVKPVCRTSELAKNPSESGPTYLLWCGDIELKKLIEAKRCSMGAQDRFKESPTYDGTKSTGVSGHGIFPAGD